MLSPDALLPEEALTEITAPAFRFKRMVGGYPSDGLFASLFRFCRQT
jgi:hypothetical protein